MATPFIMPKLGLTMEEGTISEWLVDDGTVVATGAAVLRIATDKTETDVESVSDGALHFAAEVGETFACGETIGWYLEAGEAVPERQVSQSSQAAPTQAATSPAAVAGSLAPAVQRRGGRIFVSPLARRLAAERGIDFTMVAGTGPNGRIIAADLDHVAPGPAGVVGVIGAAGTSVPTIAASSLAKSLGIDATLIAADPRTGRVSKDAVAAYTRALLASKAASPAAPASLVAESSPLPAALQPPSLVIPLTAMRGTIARRMHQSLQDMAQLTLFIDADIDAVAADRAARKAAGSAPSYTDYIVAAAARALEEHPIVNSQITDEGVALLPDVHVGLAVALDDGLMVPVISNTCDRDLDGLAAESSRLAAAARAGLLTMGELEGGTFSVSTLGMFGVDGFTPVINPPNTAILGVGRIRDDLVVIDGAVSTIKRLTLSLTWDHRAFDGAPAAAFAKTVVELLANPTALDRP